MRKGEKLGLTWVQVDFLRITVPLHAGEAKNGAPASSASSYGLDKRRHAVRIKGLRKVLESYCVKLGLGKFEPLAKPRQESRAQIAATDAQAELPVFLILESLGA